MIFGQKNYTNRGRYWTTFRHRVRVFTGSNFENNFDYKFEYNGYKAMIN